MHRGSTMDRVLQETDYSCPKCSRTFRSIKNVRDHLDIVHLHKPTRDTDEESYLPDSSSHRQPRKSGAWSSNGNFTRSLEGLEIERQLQRAKEVELRHKIFDHHSKSQDELKALNDDILSAKRRQYEMCDIIHNARQQIESLRESAEKVATDQHTLVSHLKEELKQKDNQLQRSKDELTRFEEIQLQQKSNVQEVYKESQKQKLAIVKFGELIRAKEDHIKEKHKEVEMLRNFISSATQKEMNARQKLESFVNGLLRRAEAAELQVDNLTTLISQRPQVNKSYTKATWPQNVLPPGGQQPLQHYAEVPDTRQGFLTTGQAHEQAETADSVPTPQNPAVDVHTTKDNLLRQGVHGVNMRKGRDSERPESGYSSQHHGSSRPHSQASANSELSSLLPPYDQDSLREQGIMFSDDGDLGDTFSELETIPELPMDESGIVWEAESVTTPYPTPSRPLHSTPSMISSPLPAPRLPQPSPLPVSRLSSLNSTDHAILDGFHADTQFEIQRYKFLLRDRLRMLREQEKLLWRERRDSEDGSESDLTSVTDDSDAISLSSSSSLDMSDEAGLTAGPHSLSADSKVPVLPKSAPAKTSRPVRSTEPVRPPAPANVRPPVSSPSVSERQSALRRSVLLLIFLYLDTRELLQVALVCREWRNVSQQPLLWRHIHLSKQRISSQFLQRLASRCTELQSLSLEGLRARPKRSYETFDDYKKNTRGGLEVGVEAVLQVGGRSLVSLQIKDCGNILTDRCLWLASCHCRVLRRVAYISDTDPVGSEVIWSLGAGCRDITTLIIPPLQPNERAERFNNRCVQMVSWCWPDIRMLSLGGRHINRKGLLAVARNCAMLSVLELHQTALITEEVAVAMCHIGLRQLQELNIVLSPITPEAVLKFIEGCSSLRTFNLHINLQCYFPEPVKADSRLKYQQKLRQLQKLRENPSVAKVFQLQTDSK